MSNKTLSLDEESDAKLEEIKKEDPNFNFSEFVRSRILDFSKKEEGEEEILFKISSRENKLVQLGNEINQTANEINFFKEKLIRNKIEKEQKEKEEKDRIAKLEDKKVKFFEQTKDNLKVIWDIQDENELDRLATEFIEGSFKGVNLSKFMKENYTQEVK